MTSEEMLLKLLEQSGWTVTAESDEDGETICRSDN